MEQIWYVLNTLSIGTAFAVFALLLLFLIKFKDPFFKYVLCILGLINFFRTFYAIVTFLYDTTGAGWLMDFYNLIAQAGIIPIIYLWISWSYKIVNKEFTPLTKKIALGGSVAAGIYFLLNLFVIKTTSLIFPLLLTAAATSYSAIIILTNTQGISMVPVRKYFKYFIILVSTVLAASWSILAFKSALDTLGIFYLVRDINASLYITVNSLVIVFVGKYYFDSPPKTVNPELLPAGLKDQYSLTNREEELIALILEGCTAKEIGEIMNITTQTAKNYRYKLYQKMDIRNKIDLINLVKK